MAMSDRRLYALLMKPLSRDKWEHLEDLFEDLTDYDCETIEAAQREIRSLKRRYVLQSIFLPFLLLFLLAANGVVGVVDGIRLQREAWKFLWTKERVLLERVYQDRIYVRRDHPSF